MQFLYTLKNQGFAGHPGALVLIPAGFNLQAQQFSIVVYIHGFHNCIENCVLPTISGCNCTAGAQHRDAYSLLDQFAEASANSSNTFQLQTIFVAIEVAYDQASSDPGRWATPGLFAAFLDELLSRPYLGQYLGPNRTAASSINSLRIFSHSGGYQVAADLFAVGALPDLVLEIVLLDSLYGATAIFNNYVGDALGRDRLGTGPGQVKFQSIYTDNGGTAANNVQMAQNLQTLLAAKGQSSLLLFDQTFDTLSPTQYASYPLLFKRTDLSHNDVPRYFFQQFLQWSN